MTTIVQPANDNCAGGIDLLYAGAPGHEILHLWRLTFGQPDELDEAWALLSLAARPSPSQDLLLERFDARGLPDGDILVNHSFAEALAGRPLAALLRAASPAGPAVLKPMEILA